MLYSYPIGATINGHTLTEREVRPEQPVNIGGVDYPVSIFTNWTAQERAALGIKTFVADAVPEDYTPGAPVDVETGSEIRRTYPDAAPDPVKVEAARVAAIDARIAALEATVTQRRLREAMRTSAGAQWLADVDDQINALREQRKAG